MSTLHDRCRICRLPRRPDATRPPSADELAAIEALHGAPGHSVCPPHAVALSLVAYRHPDLPSLEVVRVAREMCDLDDDAALRRLDEGRVTLPARLRRRARRTRRVARHARPVAGARRASP